MAAPVMPPRAVAGPQAWTAATLDPPASWFVPLADSCREVVDRIVADWRQSPRSIAELDLSEADRTACAEGIRPVVAALESGRGFVVVEGWPIDPDDRELAMARYWLVGRMIGEPFAQNVQGTILYDVRDTGQDVAYGARFSVTNAESTFHTDNSFGDDILDYVGLLCIRTARAGGLSQNVSGYAVHEALRAGDPDALAALYEPFHVDRRGGVRPGEGPTVERPVVVWDGGELIYRYLRYWIQAGQEKIGLPLTPRQAHALDALDAALNRPDLRAEFALAPGHMFFINNRWILHNRTAFEDEPEFEKRRHLVRLWLKRRPAGGASS